MKYIQDDNLEILIDEIREFDLKSKVEAIEKKSGYNNSTRNTQSKKLIILIIVYVDLHCCK